MTPGNLQKCIGAKSCTGFPVRNERNKITLFELALSFWKELFLFLTPTLRSMKNVLKIGGTRLFINHRINQYIHIL